MGRPEVRLQIRQQDGGESTILQSVEALDDEAEGRWAEPFALLAAAKEPTGSS